MLFWLPFSWNCPAMTEEFIEEDTCMLDLVDNYSKEYKPKYVQRSRSGTCT